VASGDPNPREGNQYNKHHALAGLGARRGVGGFAAFLQDSEDAGADQHGDGDDP